MADIQIGGKLKSIANGGFIGDAENVAYGSSNVSAMLDELFNNITYPTYGDLMDENNGLVIRVHDTESEKDIDYKLVNNSASGTDCVVGNDEMNCLGDISEQDPTLEAQAIVLGNYIVHDASYQGAGEIYSITYKGEEFDCGLELPIQFDHDLNVKLNFAIDNGIIAQLKKRLSALENGVYWLKE